MKKTVIVLHIVVLIVAGLAIYQLLSKQDSNKIVITNPTPRDTVYLKDTLYYGQSTTPSKVRLRIINNTIVDTVYQPYKDIKVELVHDTLQIIPKFSQVTYSDTVKTSKVQISYQAYVSGIDPHLDSIQINSYQKPHLLITPYLTVPNLSYGVLLSYKRYMTGVTFINNKPHLTLGYQFTIK